MMDPASSPWTTLGPLLARASRSWRRCIDVALQPYGLTEATWLPLTHLTRSAQPLRQKDLADALDLDRSAVVRLLDALETAQLVERRETEGDRRSWTIVATRGGIDIAKHVDAAAAEVRGRATLGIPAADLVTTVCVLKQICRLLKENS